MHFNEDERQKAISTKWVLSSSERFSWKKAKKEAVVACLRILWSQLTWGVGRIKDPSKMTAKKF
jgi:hypothetical protein